MFDTLDQFQKELKKSCGCVSMCLQVSMFWLMTLLHAFIPLNTIITNV